MTTQLSEMKETRSQLIEREAIRIRSRSACVQVLNLLRRAADTTESINPNGDYIANERYSTLLKNLQATLDAGRSLLERFTIAGLILAIVLLSAPAGAQYWNTSPGGMPYYQYPSMTSDGIPGPRVYLAPNGGRWVQGPPMVSEGAPPPVYIPPDDCDDDDDCCCARGYRGIAPGRHRWGHR